MSEEPSKLRSFLEELKRRHVFRVAFYYGAAAFAVLQAADIVFPALGLPDWAFRLVVVASLLGFPVTLLIAWVYDLTPEGVIRTPAVPREPDAEGEPRPSPSAVWAARAAFGLVSLVLVLGVGWLSYRWTVGEGGLGALGDRKSIAVLPFEAQGTGDETRFLADGLHEDLLSALSKIGELRVISRTSVRQYRDTELTIPEIAAELGVGTVLEGSVRRAGGRVRVTAQLIDAWSDDHVWSETYDEPEEDVFQLQTRIAEQIARALEAELSAEERTRLASPPATGSSEAYDAYNEGRVHFDRRESRAEALAAVESFRRAAELDSTFAPAHAALATARMWLFWNWPGFADQAELAGTSLDRAVELAPDAVETRMAQGYFHFYGRGDYTQALSHFRAARELEPSAAEPVVAQGLVRRRQGRWEEAVQAFREATESDPKSYNLAFALGETLSRMRRFEEAERAFDYAISLADLPGAWVEKLRVRLVSTGAPSAIRAWVGELGGGLEPGRRARLEALTAYWTRDFERVVTLRAGLPAGARAHLEVALAAHLRGDGDTRDAGARAFVEEMDTLLARTGDAPGVVQAGVLAGVHASLGIAHALLGNPAAAIREGSYATALLPVSADAVAGADQVLAMARIYALVGEHDAAIDRLQTALSIPSPLTAVELRLDPIWDSLRDHPRFRTLVAGPGVPTGTRP